MAESIGLTCQELVELVTDYLEGALPAPERRRFEEHLLDCDDCPLYLEQMRLTIRLIGTLTEEHVNGVAREELLNIFRDWRRG
jgi:hypothetical protein